MVQRTAMTTTIERNAIAANEPATFTDEERARLGALGYIESEPGAPSKASP
jgi:hypothetical protein